MKNGDLTQDAGFWDAVRKLPDTRDDEEASDSEEDTDDDDDASPDEDPIDGSPGDDLLNELRSSI